MLAKLRNAQAIPTIAPAAIACAILLAPLPATAQQAEGRFEGRVEVTEVLLDVVVTDRSGEVVAGLGPEDFLIEENGDAIEVTGASFYTTRYQGEEASRTANEVPASRYFIFFFHDQRRGATPANRLLRQQLDAAKRSQEWIEKEMGPSDWIAVASYDVKLKIHADFTQDREALLAAIEEASHSGDPERDRGRREYGTHEDASILRRLPYGIELRRETTRIYDGLRLLAEATGHIVGRKNLLLFSIGFGDLGRGPVALPDRRYYPAMEEALNANNVAVYSIDLTPSGTDHVQSSFLNTLAADTGGSYHYLFTSFTTPLRQIAQEATGYYLLSYRAEHPAGESGYREVKVKARDKQLKVRAQNGYRFGAEG